eukprot:m.177521 g.177521  ORF g.177521 m.177521 type:complete len:197 (-) comp17383_c0_seq4:6567-7157(-)
MCAQGKHDHCAHTHAERKRDRQRGKPLITHHRPSTRAHTHYTDRHINTLPLSHTQTQHTHNTLHTTHFAHSFTHSRSDLFLVFFFQRLAFIDGLRAVAVIAVVLFHAWPATFTGGFTGVDVFFVISGYLISGIVFREAARSEFTYANFYQRRIRRIYPALLLMLVCALVTGIFVLWSKELEAMCRTPQLCSPQEKK